MTEYAETPVAPTDADTAPTPTRFPIEDGSAVMAHDGYDVQEWESAVHQSRRLTDGIRTATARLATAPALFRDLFWSFYKRVPTIAPVVPLTGAHLLNRQVMEQVLGTLEWQQVRAAGTASDLVASTMATVGLAKTVLDTLPDSLVEQVNALSELESGAQELWDRAEALEELAEQAQGDQAEALYQQARTARQEAHLAQAEHETLQTTVEESLELNMDALRRAARATLTALEANLDEVQAISAAFGGASTGLGMSASGGMTTKEKIALAGKVGRSRRLKEIAALCGRMQRIALRVQRSKVKHPPDEVTNITVGNDLAHLLPSELALLTDPELEDLFFLRFAERGLLQYDLEGSEEQGQGPIIMAIDSSGSMTDALDGISKEAWAKAVMLAMLAIARLQRRDAMIMHFSAGQQLQLFPFPKGQTPYAEVLACTEFFFGGGTAFEPWMESALTLVDQSRYDRADVICVSDGLTSVHPDMQTAWQHRRQQRGMRAYGVLIGTRQGAGVLASLTDAMLTLDSLQDDLPILETIFNV